MISTNQQQQAVATRTTKAQSPITQTMRIAVLLTALTSATSFQIGGLLAIGSRPLALQQQTRNRRRISTMFYANSAEDRWIASSSSNPDDAAPERSSFSIRDATQRPEGGPGDEAVDEYLEFLAKRYRRLHEDDEVSSTGAFSTWKWLGLGNSDSHAAELSTHQSEENALYALGVAGLASKKLLQKHRVSSEKLRAAAAESDDAADAIDCAATSTTEEEEEQQPKTSVVQAAGRVVHSVGAARRALHEYQNSRLRTAARAVARAPVRLGRKLFELGGGRKTVGLSATFAVALVLVLVKPAAQFVASESVNMTRGA